MSTGRNIAAFLATSLLIIASKTPVFAQDRLEAAVSDRYSSHVTYPSSRIYGVGAILHVQSKGSGFRILSPVCDAPGLSLLIGNTLPLKVSSARGFTLKIGGSLDKVVLNAVGAKYSDKSLVSLKNVMLSDVSDATINGYARKNGWDEDCIVSVIDHIRQGHNVVMVRRAVEADVEFIIGTPEGQENTIGANIAAKLNDKFNASFEIGGYWSGGVNITAQNMWIGSKLQNYTCWPIRLKQLIGVSRSCAY